MSAWCTIFSACWSHRLFLDGLRFTSYSGLPQERHAIFALSDSLSVCLSWFSVRWRKDSFSAFQPTDKVSFQCCVGVCSVRAYSAERERARERGLPVVLYCNGRLRAAPAVCEEGDWWLRGISEELSKSYSACLSTQSIIHFSTCSKGIGCMLLDRWCVRGFWNEEAKSLLCSVLFDAYSLWLKTYGTVS